MILIFHS